jgi:hypothetical protein
MPAGLFRPFWRSLSVTIVKNFQSRPYMAEQLCDLLGMKVDDFLRLTEIYILPYLVLTRKRDIIVRIGATYNDAKSPFDICSEKNNLAAILAFLLCQPSSNPEGMIMSLLAEVDPAFKGRTLGELVRIEPILIACDLLKGLGDSEEKQAKVSTLSDMLHFHSWADFACWLGQISPSSSPSCSSYSSEVIPREFVEESKSTEPFHRGACSRYHHPVRPCDQ